MHRRLSLRTRGGWWGSRGAAALAGIALVLGAALVTVVPASPATVPGHRPGTRSSAATRGTVDVLYAGSLLRLMEDRIGPASTRATGYSFSGFAAGSSELANEIKGGVRQGDVFVSASPKADASLEGTGNGNWVRWYAAFAKAPLVLGYEPGDRFAAALRRSAWYDVVTRPGFLLGRTDPVLDPKGVLSAEALRLAAARTGKHQLLALLGSTSGVFPEEALLGRLEAGQLDAGFFYAHEARAAGISYVAIPPVHLFATFTVTVLERAPHRAAALAFVRYLLGPAGRRALARDGFKLVVPVELRGHGIPVSLARLAARR